MLILDDFVQVDNSESVFFQKFFVLKFLLDFCLLKIFNVRFS